VVCAVEGSLEVNYVQVMSLMSKEPRKVMWWFGQCPIFRIIRKF
jgi:hypothetical protein